MNRLISLWLQRRGLSLGQVRQYNSCEHANLAHVDRLCSELNVARERGDLVVILPDFDCDGVMSATVLYAGLNELGFRCEVYHPDPSRGYGVSIEDVDLLCSEFPDVRYVITCDTGMGAVSAVAELKRRGIHVLVTDHHKEIPGESSRACADVVVNPNGVDDTYFNKRVCGAYVAWQCLMTYACTRQQWKIDAIERLKLFAGIGTVSDSMDMLYENREVVRGSLALCRLFYGDAGHELIESMNACDEYKRAFVGIEALVDGFARASKYFTGPDSIDESFYGFSIAPSINAVKRMGGEMGIVYDLFCGRCDTEECVEYMLATNESRKAMVRSIMASIDERDFRDAPYVYKVDALPGVLGLIASNLCESSGIPVCVVRDTEDGKLAGSGRSPAWLDFISEMESAADVHGVVARGHEQAFGVSFADARAVHEYKRHIKEAIHKKAPAAGAGDRIAELRVGEGPGFDIGFDAVELRSLLDELDEYRPFGRGFEAPDIEFTMDFNMDGIHAKRVRDHIIVNMPGGVSATLWNQASLLGEGELNGVCVCRGTLERNTYKGMDSPQLNGHVTHYERDGKVVFDG